MKNFNENNQELILNDYVGELKISYRRSSLAKYQVKSASTAVDYMRKYFDECMDSYECAKVLHLNKNNCVVNVSHLACGTDNACLISPKDILRECLYLKTSSILLFHNHPSGSLKASDADKRVSNKLREACELIEVSLLDSIIITRESYTSLAEEGYI